MLPPISEKPSTSSSKLRWQKSTRRISHVKLPLIRAKGVRASEDEPTEPIVPPIVPTITPSLCIDNQYFANYINETPKMDDVDYLSRAFKSNIEQQTNKISEALGCLSVCNEVAERYHCSLSSSLETLVNDFAEKAFKLSSLTCQLHALRQTHQANQQVRKAEESQLDDIAWRIEREQRRIRKLDEKLEKFYENREIEEGKREETLIN